MEIIQKLDPFLSFLVSIDGLSLFASLHITCALRESICSNRAVGRPQSKTSGVKEAGYWRDQDTTRKKNPSDGREKESVEKRAREREREKGRER